jgi:hypothetical protein
MRSIILLYLVAVGCGDHPTPTGTLCPSPDPMTFGYTAADTPGCTGSAGDCNFGKTFMDTYCTNCHSSLLTKPSMRNGAPIFHDFDSLDGVLEVPDHIDEETGIGPKAANHFMPGAGTGGRCPSTLGGPLDEACPEPTDQERTNLALWIACERNRSHDLVDAGVGLEIPGDI